MSLLTTILLGALAAAHSQTVALYPVQGNSVGPATIELIERTADTTLRRVGNKKALSKGATISVLYTMEQNGFRCDGAVSCLTEVGKRMQVEQLLYLEVKQKTLSLQLISVDTGAVIGHGQEQLPASPVACRRLVEASVVKLLAPEQYTGALLVLAEPGAILYVDEIERGELPLVEPLRGLSVGEHAIRLRFKENREMERLVKIQFSQVAEVDLREGASGLGQTSYNNQESTDGAVQDRPIAASNQTWPLWAAGGLGLASAAAAIICAVSWSQAVEANQRALSWAIREHDGSPPKNADGVEQNYQQPLQWSAQLQLAATAAAVTATVLGIAAAGTMGYALVESSE